MEAWLEVEVEVVVVVVVERLKEVVVVKMGGVGVRSRCCCWKCVGLVGDNHGGGCGWR